MDLNLDIEDSVFAVWLLIRKDINLVALNENERRLLRSIATKDYYNDPIFYATYNRLKNIFYEEFTGKSL